MPPSGKPVRLAYVVSHPIQYQAPLLRRIAREPGIDLTVFFSSDFSLRAYPDEGFGIPVHWDIPLTEGYRHEFLPKLWGSGIHTVSRGFLARLRNFDALWVHGYNTPNAIHAILAAKALGIPVLLRAESWLHDRPRSPLKLALKKLAFQLLRPWVDAVLPIGTRNAAYWTHYFGDSVPHFPMPYAVDNAFFQTRTRAAAKDREVLRHELNLQPGRPVILFASKLQPRKRCAHLITAYAALIQSGLTLAPYLVIVGDGEQRAALEALAAHLEGVRFTGFRNQSELPRFFDLATIFVLPAQHEPWGLIVNEAMNAARPIILTDAIGCQPDLVRHGVDGLVYPVGDIPALTAALNQVLAFPELAPTMGQNALARIDQWTFEQDLSGLRAALSHVTAASRTWIALPKLGR